MNRTPAVLGRALKFSTAKEWIDQPEVLHTKIVKLAEMVRQAKYPIFFTGAGCSTSLGIPDYRSGQDTVVTTGPGIWNRAAQQKPPKLRIDEIVDMAAPSLTHMAIKTLLSKDIFKFLVSQNTDGLHLRSGVEVGKIAQLHGNRNLEKCTQCQHAYFRDFRTIRRKVNQKQGDEIKDHLTGRNCENCGGPLIDSIIYFGEKLPVTDLSNAFQHAAQCDLVLCIGSSLTVKPSANVPLLAYQRGARVGIVNIQETPFDQVAHVKLNNFCDDVMGALMKQLQIQIDPFVIEHYLQISMSGGRIKIAGKDKQMNNFTYIRSAQIEHKQYEPVGHYVEAPLSESEHEVELRFFGSKTPLTLFIPSYFKLHHGEDVCLKIDKRQQEQRWAIHQL